MTDARAQNVPRLLITGFEPFGRLPVNPSWELAQRFQGETIDMVDVFSARLPVNWAGAWPALEAALVEVRPSWLLLLGLGETRRVAGVEVRARNFTNPLADNAGALPPPDDRIEPDGPAYRLATIPASLVAERLQLAGVPAEVSMDAGGYLCNWTLYKALAAAPRYRLGGVGFIHVPPLPEQGGPPIPLDLLERGLRLAVESVVAGAAPLFATVEAEIESERAGERAPAASATPRG